MKKFIYSFLVLLIMFSLQFFVIPQKTMAQGWTEGQTAVSSEQTGLPESSANDVVMNILQWTLGLVFLLAILAFVGAGIMYIMSFGNTNLAGTAKDWLTYAVIGLVISVLGFVIITTVSNILTGEESSSSGSSTTNSDDDSSNDNSSSDDDFDPYDDGSGWEGTQA